MFLGWFTQPDGGTQVTASTAFAANSTIYAHWIKTGSVNEIKIVISPRTTVAQIIENFGFVSGTTAVNKDGTAITGSAFVGTGSTINLTNGIKIITIIYGDVNGDGDVASGDPVALARYIAEIENLSSYGLEAADVNGDGKVNILDLIRLSRYMAGLDMLPLGQP